MENIPLTLGAQDIKSDAHHHQHSEHHDRHTSKNGALCFDDNVSRNSMHMDQLSCDFGVTTTGTNQEMEDILNTDVLHEDMGYLRLHNDFCSIGNEYLLGSEFVETLDGLQSSVTGSLAIPSFSCMDATWKSDIFQTTDVHECTNHQLNIDDCGCGESSRQCSLLRPSAEEKLSRSTSSCTLEDVDKFQSISSCSFQDILSDEADVSTSPSKDIAESKKKDVNDMFVSVVKNDEASGSPDETLTRSSPASGTDEYPISKRSRRPTQRYIDELPDPTLRQSKKRRLVTSSMPKDRSPAPEAKNRKKCPAGSKPVKSDEEEFSVKAIQVPFGSLGHKECPESPKTPAYEPPRLPERGYAVIKSKEMTVSTRAQRRSNESTLAVRPKNDQNANAMTRKKDQNTTLMPQKKDQITTLISRKKRKGEEASHVKKKKHHIKAEKRKKRDKGTAAVSPSKKESCLTNESCEEGSARRKHHILWTIAEVKQLIDGVSEFGVGRWSRIKKLFFSSSAHRTSVDLKDKWRNLLKASGLVEKSNRKGGDRRSMAWRPLPKAIMRRVCELAVVHPYPKGQKQKTPTAKHIQRRGSPDRSTDMTLNDYRKIIRSNDAN